MKEIILIAVVCLLSYGTIAIVKQTRLVDTVERLAFTIGIGVEQ